MAKLDVYYKDMEDKNEISMKKYHELEHTLKEVYMENEHLTDANNALTKKLKDLQ